MFKIALFQHIGSYNHGCEALVRTASKLTKDFCGDAQIYLCSLNPEQDKKYLLDDGWQIIRNRHCLKKWSINWCIYQLNKRFFSVEEN